MGLVNVGTCPECCPMSHVLGLARLLLDVEDDEAFVDALDRALDVLVGISPSEGLTLLDLVAGRIDAILGDVSRETEVTNGADVSRETEVTTGAGAPGAQA